MRFRFEHGFERWFGDKRCEQVSKDDKEKW
jgi:hypothetical protein